MAGEGTWSAPRRRRRSPGFNEAPASWPGKALTLAALQALGAPASMRPRLRGRGRAARRGGRPPDRERFNEAPASWPGKGLGCFDAAPRDSRASMRPRLRGRGRPWPRPRKPGGSNFGFNEAPASWPGKGARETSTATPRSSRFNEAPASWPGKASKTRTQLPNKRTASMRPRLRGRGRGPGRGDDGRTESASMRPRLRGRGRRRRVWATVVTCLGFNEAPASWPGKGPLARVQRPGVHGASMRPRLRGRGRASWLGACNGWVGHRFNEAPASWPGKGWHWTHCRATRSSFNEAPASWPGKAPSRARGRAWCAPASMRPRLRGRGRPSPSPRCPTSSSPSFNEAPASWPGKERD